MKKDLVELVFILDASGSMRELTKDTVGGVNSILDKAKADRGEALVTTVLFHTRVKTVYDRVPLEKVPLLTENDYCAQGCTALLDAVGETISNLKRLHRHIGEDDVPEKTVVVIMTDGMENSSRIYDYDAVKQLIEGQKEQGWEFIFLAANIDAASASGQIGIDAAHAVDWVPDRQGQRLAFEGISKSVHNVRMCGCSITEEAFAKVRHDFDERKRRYYEKRDQKEDF